MPTLVVYFWWHTGLLNLLYALLPGLDLDPPFGDYTSVFYISVAEGSWLGHRR